jgi:serine/threonine protein kinase/TolB-like protein/Flp pilus assembly protein TadD
MTPVNPARPLNTERWLRIENIFHQARSQRDGAREEALRRLCGGDEELLAEVRALLGADTEANRPRAAKETQMADLAGRRAGNYQLDSLLGTGGMGSVYLAHRCDGQFDRQVAFKILGANLRSEFFTDRFAVERQLLASLDHPHITRLLDSGVSGEGDPYLVLEYVDGEPIDEYCDERRLRVRDRIRLFLQVCAAVEFAHSQRVLHRDLKPSNILVAAAVVGKPPVGNGGVVKLLDFGTAKLLESASDTNATATRFRMMTPRYASPEQLRGDPQTAATDVYSLGIVLYELLTGAWPFGDPQSVISGLERAVREVEPRHPKTVIDDRAAARRGLPKQALIDAVSGDPWKVILKAIEADPGRRYGSVADLASDLNHYLEGKPVLARPQTLQYRVGKFVRRNRIAVAAALVVAMFAAIAVVAAGTSVFPKRIAVSTPPSIAVLPFIDLSADPADKYFSDGLTDEITDSLARMKTVQVIARSSSFQFKGKTTDVREVGRLLNVTHVLEGSVERSGDRIKIIAHLERVSDGSLLWSNTFERKASDLFAVQSELAAGIASGLKVAAEAPGRKHVPNAEAHDLVIKARYDIQQMTTESVTRAEAEYRRAIDLDPEYAAAYLGLANAKYDQFAARGSTFQTEAERKSAEQLFRKALELDPDLPSAHAMLATLAMQYDWDWDGAEREFRLAVAGPSSAGAESFYAFLLVFRGRFDEADRHVQRMVDLDPFSTSTMNNLAVARNLEGRFAEAREISQKMAAQYPAMIAPQQAIGGTYIEEGHPELAFPIFAQLKQRYPQAQLFEAMAFAAAGQREEALTEIRPYEEKYPNSGVSMAWFALVYALMGDEPDTVKWLQRSADMHEWQALNLAVNPVYARMRNSSGFRALKKRMGLDQ